jgi:bifunctional DNase/RNase
MGIIFRGVTVLWLRFQESARSKVLDLTVKEHYLPIYIGSCEAIAFAGAGQGKESTIWN